MAWHPISPWSLFKEHGGSFFRWLFMREAYVNFLSFTLINFLKWPHWLRLWTVSLFEGFNHIKNTCVLICDLVVSGVLWCSIWGTNSINSYMVSELFEGRIHWWSKSEVGTTASNCHFLDLLFLSTFRPRGPLCCVRSIFSSEEPLSFHTKRLLVALATSVLRSGGIQSSFAVTIIYFSVYFSL